MAFHGVVGGLALFRYRDVMITTAGHLHSLTCRAVVPVSTCSTTTVCCVTAYAQACVQGVVAAGALGTEIAAINIAGHLHSLSAQAKVPASTCSTLLQFVSDRIRAEGEVRHGAVEGGLAPVQVPGLATVVTASTRNFWLRR
jgi:hypothetical protein